MKLGRKEKASDFMDALKTEVGIEEVEPLNNPSASGSATGQTSPAHLSSDRKHSILASPIKTEA